MGFIGHFHINQTVESAFGNVFQISPKATLNCDCQSFPNVSQRRRTANEKNESSGVMPGNSGIAPIPGILNDSQESIFFKENE
ncbi:MAG TPA: hypothetical protein DCX10_13015 [Verrucomicrobiales bacterium]|nr:hypothetical protein [Verrucomicrobiales bacterium]